jgi:hypothetical protein
MVEEHLAATGSTTACLALGTCLGLQRRSTSTAARFTLKLNERVGTPHLFEGAGAGFMHRAGRYVVFPDIRRLFADSLAPMPRLEA